MIQVFQVRENTTKGKLMRRIHKIQAWQILAGIFTFFWILFATILIISNFPFLVISMALTTVGALSVLVTILAWAYQKNL